MDTPTSASEQAPSADQARWFSEQVHPHDGQLKAYLRGSFPSVRDVDDVVQESYVRVWRRQATKPIESAKNFLFEVARNLALDWMRHDRVSPIDAIKDLAGLSVMDHANGVAERACLNEETMLLLEAIDALPGRCRDVFRLRKLRGLSHRAISREMGISEATVEAQIARATQRCEAFLRRRGVSFNSKQ